MSNLVSQVRQILTSKHTTTPSLLAWRLTSRMRTATPCYRYVCIQQCSLCHAVTLPWLYISIMLARRTGCCLNYCLGKKEAHRPPPLLFSSLSLLSSILPLRHCNIGSLLMWDIAVVCAWQTVCSPSRRGTFEPHLSESRFFERASCRVYNVCELLNVWKRRRKSIVSIHHWI